MEKKYNYVYKTTNKLNGMEYIGVHSTDNIDDNYLGSGTYLNYAIKKYGRENFIKEIIESFTTRKESLLKEKELVSIKYVQNISVYNLVLGGGSPECREISISKFKRGEEKQKFINFNNPEIDNYIADIPIKERALFYGDKEALLKLATPCMVRYMYLSIKKEKNELSEEENSDYMMESIRNQIGQFIIDNIDDFAKSLTLCYNNKRQQKAAIKILKTLFKYGVMETGVKVKKYNIA